MHFFSHIEPATFGFASKRVTTGLREIQKLIQADSCDGYINLDRQDKGGRNRRIDRKRSCVKNER